ncbi:DUF523 domain-containing protein [Cytobacillus spongiae]|jgi:uncharacterized protein YbbK (DUF523 family)|uniref:DUF523 domain-containing protein n=1 Tax=Cytobacillus spongiae TaxID=2901381 RepID=UPI001F2299A3|nr:DUF523 domain-containing protein [Cytobacillus spongiae]UII57084.1 DUF523 domain-containing protein [Cytobacillus spongiae]
MIVVSACLAGLEVRYDGGHCLHQKLLQLVEEKKATTICPEVLGGLATPREPAEIIGGDGADVLNGTAKVIDLRGEDVTAPFIKGAYEALTIVRELKGTTVVLKENSPSCGSTMIYSGEFNGRKVAGNGVTAALFKKNGIKVISEKQLQQLFLEA